MIDELKGKVAIVTGGARDIGRAVALKLGLGGANVMVNYYESEVQAEEVVKEIQAKGSKAVAVKADVSKWDEVQFLISETKRMLGDDIDILVNNAGYHLGEVLGPQNCPEMVSFEGGYISRRIRRKRKKRDVLTP